MVIRHDACRQLGKVPVPKQHCFYAGRCVCEEPGMSLKQFIDRVGWSMTHAIDAAGSQANKARRKALFKGADIVLRFQWPAPPGNAAPDALHESWYHLALLYDTPTRPTFVTMTRYPDIDYADCIGLDTATVPGALQLHAVWGSAYDALGDVSMFLNRLTTVKFYRLVGDPLRIVFEIRPRYQHVRALECDPFELWTIKKPYHPQEKKVKDPKPPERGRGRRGGKGKGRGRPCKGRGKEPEPLPDEPKPPLVDEVDEGDDKDAWVLSGDEAENDDHEETADEKEPEEKEPGVPHEDDPFIDPDQEAFDLFAPDYLHADTDEMVRASGTPVPSDAEEVIDDVVMELIHGVGEPEAPMSSSSSSTFPAVGVLEKSDTSMRLRVKGGLLIFNNKARTLFAECTERGHGKCVLSRAVRHSPLAGRPWQGWPVAGCIEWLAAEVPKCTSTEHVIAHLPSRQDRQRRRTQLIDDPCFRQFFEAEASDELRREEPDVF